MGELREVYHYLRSNEISLTYTPGECVCFGETEEDAESFLMFMRKEWIQRGSDLSRLPTIRKGG